MLGGICSPSYPDIILVRKTLNRLVLRIVEDPHASSCIDVEQCFHYLPLICLRSLLYGSYVRCNPNILHIYIYNRYNFIYIFHKWVIFLWLSIAATSNKVFWRNDGPPLAASRRSGGSVLQPRKHCGYMEWIRWMQGSLSHSWSWTVHLRS